jgi:hypothetical protein
MKFLIMLYGNPELRRAWEGLPVEERIEGLKAYDAVRRTLTDAGEFVASEALDDPPTATLVSVRDGRTITSDGPFAEAKEHLAGFFLVDCESRERAVEVAAQLPEATFGTVEVRPIRDISEWTR